MAEEQTEQIDKDVLHAALYKGPAGTTKLHLDFTIGERAQALLKDATAFLYSLPKKPAAAESIREDAELIRAEVERCMSLGRNCPGFIMAVGNHIPPNTPVENAIATRSIGDDRRIRPASARRVGSTHSPRNSNSSRNAMRNLSVGGILRF